MAEPDVAVIPPANDVALVGGSIFVHAHLPIDVHITINMGMGSSGYVRSAMMAAPSVVTSTAMASTVAFRIRWRHYSKSERRSDRKDETNLLQHFVFLAGYKTRHRTLAKGSWTPTEWNACGKRPCAIWDRHRNLASYSDRRLGDLAVMWACQRHAPVACAIAVIRSDKLRAGARCIACGRKGATLQRPCWAGNNVGFYPVPIGNADVFIGEWAR
jgi:hypothetical protein